MGEGKVGWITKIMEYDIEIKPTKLIRGMDLYENMVGDLHMIANIEDEEHLNQKVIG